MTEIVRPYKPKSSTNEVEVVTTVYRYQSLYGRNSDDPKVSTFLVWFFGDKGIPNKPVTIGSLADLANTFFEKEITPQRYGKGAKFAKDVLTGKSAIEVLAVNLVPTFTGSYKINEGTAKETTGRNHPALHSIAILEVGMDGLDQSAPRNSSPTSRTIQYRIRKFDPKNNTADEDILAKSRNIYEDIINSAQMTTENGITWAPILAFSSTYPGTQSNDLAFNIGRHLDRNEKDVMLYDLSIYKAGNNLYNKVFSFDDLHTYNGMASYISYTLAEIEGIDVHFIKSTYDILMEYLNIDIEDYAKIDIFGTQTNTKTVKSDPSDSTSPDVEIQVPGFYFMSPELSTKYDNLEISDKSYVVTNEDDKIFLQHGSKGQFIGDNTKENLVKALLSGKPNLRNALEYDIGEWYFENLFKPKRAYFDTVVDFGFTTEQKELAASLESSIRPHTLSDKDTPLVNVILNAEGVTGVETERYLRSLGGGKGIRSDCVSWFHGYTTERINGFPNKILTSEFVGNQLAVGDNSAGCPAMFPYTASGKPYNGIIPGKIEEEMIFDNAPDYYLNEYGLNTLDITPSLKVFVCNNKTSLPTLGHPFRFISIRRTVVYTRRRIIDILTTAASTQKPSDDELADIKRDVTNFLKTVSNIVDVDQMVLDQVSHEVEGNIYVLTFDASYTSGGAKFVLHQKVRMESSATTEQ